MSPQTPVEQRYYTIEDVMNILSVGRETVYGWCRDGVLDAAKFGRRWQIDPRSLDDLPRRVREAQK